MVALTGDIHAFFAGPVMDDYDAATPAPVMVDLITAGLSSNFVPGEATSRAWSIRTRRSRRQAAGRYRRTERHGRNQAFNSTLSAFNPWLKHVNTDAQGYAVVS